MALEMRYRIYVPVYVVSRIDETGAFVNKAVGEFDELQEAINEADRFENELLRDGITDDSYVVEEFLDRLDVGISLGELQRWDEELKRIADVIRDFDLRYDKEEEVGYIEDIEEALADKGYNVNLEPEYSEATTEAYELIMGAMISNELSKKLPEEVIFVTEDEERVDTRPEVVYSSSDVDEMSKNFSNVER